MIHSRSDRRLPGRCICAFWLTLVVTSTTPGQQIQRNGFEGREPLWTRGPADAPFQETAHAITDQTAHSGQFCEHLQLTAEKGSFIQYVYPVGRAPVSDELVATLWLKANRPGAQFLARLVLPKERNPRNLDEPLTTMLRGEIYQRAGRWQQLELRRPTKLVTEQQQMMRAELKRDVDFSDAYIDRLFLNVYGGPGVNDLWIDDLEIGPVLDTSPAPQTPGKLTSIPTRDGSKENAAPIAPTVKTRPTSRSAVVEVNQDKLTVSGQSYFFTMIRHTDTPLKVLRDAGLNTLGVDYGTPRAVLEEAVNLGFWLVPALPVTREESHLATPDALNQEVLRFLIGDAVLFWDLGGALVSEQNDAVRRAAEVIHAADPGRPLGGDVWDGFRPFGRSLDLIGVHRWPLMTSLELLNYYQWLDQRRLLARPGAFMWTWVQTHLPDWFTALVFEHGDVNGFSEPIGPQPEQIRILTYLALSAGFRGLGFWSDRYLADTHQGRDRLLALAMLTQELQMIEPLLNTTDAPQWVATSAPDVQGAVLRSEKGILVLPMWLGKGGQFVPGQAAASRVVVTVPQVPANAQAWQVSPGEVRSIPSTRVPGGTRITIPEFGVTAAIVFTSDNGPTGLIVRFQDYARRKRQLAAQYAHDLAQVELEKVTRVETELETAGHLLPDGAALIADTKRRLATCLELWNNGLYGKAYLEAQRALRPLRILMRGQWDLAVAELDVPTSSPYAVSFYTLPRHWQFMDELKKLAPGRNLLPEGRFEDAPDRLSAIWNLQETTLDQVTLTARVVTGLVVEPPETPEDKPGTPRSTPKLVDDDDYRADYGSVGLGALDVGLSEEPEPAPLRKPAPTIAQSREDPKEGKQCLMLQILPKPNTVPPKALERTFLALTSPPVRARPGSIVRISGWVRLTSPIFASADGALLFDSVGGEPLAVRLSNYTKRWKQYALYRRVPSSGVVTVTVALTGIGTVLFDDLRVEPMEPSSTVFRPRSEEPALPGLTSQGSTTSAR